MTGAPVARPLLAPAVRTSVSAASESFESNRADMLDLLGTIDDLVDQAQLGGGQRALDRLRSRDKMPIRERIAHVLDPDTPFLEISPLAAYASDYAMGGGLVCGIGIIAGTECVVMGNDPTAMAGAMTPYSTKKWMRAMEIARENHIPYVSFVESAGGDLRIDADAKDVKSVPGGMQIDHFAQTGRFFYELTELSKLGIPTVCVVMGSSTAGGAYQPGLSDYNIVVKEQSKIFLAGPPLVQMATGEISDDETLGGAQMHAEVSGLGDYFAEDEMDAIRICREVVSHLDWRKHDDRPPMIADPPVLDEEELLGLVGKDLRKPLDVREIYGRIVDGSRFEEYKTRYGPNMVCGWGQIHGHTVGFLGNNGVIETDAAEKAATFVQLCNQIDVPLIFVHNITGFMVGKDYEAAGIIKKGSQMVNAVSNSTVPHISLIVGGSYGAGNYGMSGRAFGNRFTFLWPTAKIAVMGPKQIAGVMSLVRRGQAARKGIDIDEAEEARQVEAAETIQERNSLALYATGAVTDDGIVDPRDTRTVLAMCLSVVRNTDVKGTEGYGVFRL